jgi:hypothetical protein
MTAGSFLLLALLKLRFGRVFWSNLLAIVAQDSAVSGEQINERSGEETISLLQKFCENGFFLATGAWRDDYGGWLSSPS